ncbi:hypothetical protein OSTOST_01890 [Ostertagia ostertagi]
MPPLALANLTLRPLLSEVVRSGSSTYHQLESVPPSWLKESRLVAKILPVIIRSSAQWFFDVSSIGKRAAELAEGIKIGSEDSGQFVLHSADFAWEVTGTAGHLSNTLRRMVSSRPSWCISRQRVWGTPIPALIDGNEVAYISEELVELVADFVDQYGPDIWWTCSLEDLLTKEVLKSLNLSSAEGLSKGTDIMDVWMDSGVAWHCARKAYDDADATLAFKIGSKDWKTLQRWKACLGNGAGHTSRVNHMPHV